MITYWLIFGIFAFAALVWRDQRNLTQYPQVAGHTAPAKRRSLMPLFTGILLSLVIGLRYRVGGDWANYASAYSEIAYLNWGQALAVSRQEPGYTLINWLSAQAGAGMWLVNLLCAFPFTAGLIRLSQRLGNPALALAVATPFLIIVVGMGYTRQATALGFLMLGIVELVEKRSLRRFIAFILLGALFHRTVLIFIPIVLFSQARTWLGSALLAGLALLIAYFTLIRGALDRYGAGYLQADYDAQGAVVRVAMNLLPALMLLFSGNRLFQSFEERDLWRAFAFLAIGAAAALMLIQSSVVVDRLSIYLIPLQLFVFVRIADAATSNANSSLTWRALIIAYSALVLFVWLNFAAHAYAWVPYRSYLFEGA